MRFLPANTSRPADAGARVHVLIISLLLLAVALPAPARVNAYRGQLELPTYPWWPPVKHPYFRPTDGRNIYPYPMLDNLSRDQTRRVYQTVVLENDYLRLTFLPELGGKIHEVIDKTTGKPMFYLNEVIKPGLIGQCGAWTSGGVEWNTGPQGHTVSCMQPVAVHLLPPAKDGSRTVAIGETERIYRTRWTVMVTLRPDRAFIEERIRLHNPTPFVRPYYFWNCTALPNTPGFRFIYPMTLGCDHGAENFFHWPIDEGRDMTRGTNYQDAASIFAWHCDQDFFGAYDDDADRGVVSFANHHELPGKKAWTWGQGGFGRMHQMDLTDTSGPYNEVQTGPLLTQADVGRLDPHQTITWQEWWYPIHGLGGFNFANRNLAANAEVRDGHLELRLLGTGNWREVQATVARNQSLVAVERCSLSPEQPARLRLDLAGNPPPVEVELVAGQELLARFTVPLDLPQRQPPPAKEPPQTATELAEAGWQQLLFAKDSEAEERFRQALAADPMSATARVGLALLNLEAYPLAAATDARAALAAQPGFGLAHLVLATALLRSENEADALDSAWQAARDPATAVAARALIGRLLIRRNAWSEACQALTAEGPWHADPSCRNLLAFAFLKTGARSKTIELARATLDFEPLDPFARSLLWLARAEDKSLRLADLLSGQPQPMIDLVAQYAELNQTDQALSILEEFYLKPTPPAARQPIPCYWAAWLAARQNNMQAAEILLSTARSLPPDGVFPHRHETVPVLRWALALQPQDARAALYLGHLLFALGRHAEGRESWYAAASHRATAPVALRALGMAALKIDRNLTQAETTLKLAHRIDPADPIIARDLARACFDLAAQAATPEARQAHYAQARDVLRAGLAAGRIRSDYVALLARAHNHLGQYAETARLLDSVRVTVWEGAREVHDLFVAAHLALGQAHLDAGRAADALAEFNRALEYPENLATGRLENAREAHIHYRRGNALAALGQAAEARAAWEGAAAEPPSQNPAIEEARTQARAALNSARAQ